MSDQDTATVFGVVSGTPFGRHVHATFDTKKEAFAYIDAKQPFQKIRMCVVEVDLTP